MAATSARTTTLVWRVLPVVALLALVAHRVGEPFGSLVLAVAVTVIEVSLIVTLMLSGGDEASTLARETVFAAVMITVGTITAGCTTSGAPSPEQPSTVSRASTHSTTAVASRSARTSAVAS